MSGEDDREINWSEVIEKGAIGENGLDLGTIKQVEDDYIVTEVSGINKRKYHLPKTSVNHFNGVFLNFSLNDSNVSAFEQKNNESNLGKDSSVQFPGDLSLKEESEREVGATIPLIGEDLKVNKRIIENNIKIIKEPIRETKTVQIELMHEKITLKRKIIEDSSVDKIDNLAGLINDQSSSYESSKASRDKGSEFSKSEFFIPIKREEPVVTKSSYVREEIIVKKRPVTETETITENVINEKIGNDNEINEGKDRFPI
jgi:stress response protein YsnF